VAVFMENQRGAPRSFSCWGFVGDVRFRSLVGSIEEFSNWYGPGGPCTPQYLGCNKGPLGIRSSLRKLRPSPIPIHVLFFYLGSVEDI